MSELDKHVIDRIEPILRDLEYASSIDFYLIKLGAIISIVEDAYGSRAKEALRRILGTDCVKRFFRGLAGCRDVVEQLIALDVRHAKLRKYIDVLTEFINSLGESPCLLLVSRHEVASSTSSDTRGYEVYEAVEEAPISLHRFDEEVWDRQYIEPVKQYVGSRKGSSKRRKVLVAIAIAVVLVIAVNIFLLSEHKHSAIPEAGDAISALGKLTCFRCSKISIGDVQEVGYEILGYQPYTGVDAVWKTLEFIDKNIEYDYSSAMSLPYLLYDKSYDDSTSVEFSVSNKKIVAKHPLETLRRRSGVCIDMALLAATALLYANISHVYILVIEPSSGAGHAAALAEINNTYFVLDQHLPPIELSDYVEYVLRGYNT